MTGREKLEFGSVYLVTFLILMFVLANGPGDVEGVPPQEPVSVATTSVWDCSDPAVFESRACQDRRR